MHTEQYQNSYYERADRWVEKESFEPYLLGLGRRLPSHHVDSGATAGHNLLQDNTFICRARTPVGEHVISIGASSRRIRKRTVRFYTRAIPRSLRLDACSDTWKGFKTASTCALWLLSKALRMGRIVSGVQSTKANLTVFAKHWTKRSHVSNPYNRRSRVSNVECHASASNT